MEIELFSQQGLGAPIRRNCRRPQTVREIHPMPTLKAGRLSLPFAIGMLAFAAGAHADQQSVQSACAAINPAGAKLRSLLNTALDDPSVDASGMLKVYQTATADFIAATKSVTNPLAKSAVDAVAQDLNRMTSASAELATAAEAGKSTEIIRAITVTQFQPAADSFQHDWDVRTNALCDSNDQ
jgi:hypothetical protein